MDRESRIGFLVLLTALILGYALGGMAQAAIAFKSGELATGNTKQCLYEYLGNTYVITIPSYRLCPLTINVQG